MRKKEYIKVPLGGIKKIAADVGCSRLTVSNALNGLTDTMLADKIRAEAMKNYGGSYVVQTFNKAY